MSYNSALLKKLSMELPKADWTLDDFYELAVELRKRDCYISAYQPLWTSDYAWRYFDTYGTGTITDDGTMLRKLLTITKKLIKENLLYKFAAGEEDYSKLPENVLFGFTNAQTAFVYSRADVIVYPTFDNERDFCANTSFLQMNIHSQNKDAAATVIAEFMKPGGDYTNPLLGFMYYKDMSVYQLKMTPEQATKNGVMLNDLTNMDEKTTQNMALYLNILSHVNVKRTYLEWIRFAAAECEKYYNDEQDLDYTVEFIYNRAKLMLEE
jgi:Bacterial extracellular solute-binding protein.